MTPSLPQKLKKRVPLGRPIKRTDKDLERLATVTPDDIAKAQALWHNYAPDQFKSLLDAKTVEK